MHVVREVLVGGSSLEPDKKTMEAGKLVEAAECAGAQGSFCGTSHSPEKNRVPPNRYLLRPEDAVFVNEFMANPVGYHSPGLQRVLNVMRGGPLLGKYVLVVLEPYRRWALGQLPAHRGEPVTLLKGVEYTDRIEAERDVFRRRWRQLVGEELSSAVVSEGAVGTK
jgi:hypothetical protein